MSEYSNPPKTHLRDPHKHWSDRGYPKVSVCRVWLVGLKSTDDYKDVTCKNCKRTHIFRMKRMGVSRPEWRTDV